MDVVAATIGAALAGAAALGCAVVRMVPAGHRGVVIRAGRVGRSRASGPALVLPGVERIDMVALHPRTVERVLHRVVANVDLATLLRDRGSLLAGLPVTASPLLSPIGVEIIDVDLLDVEVRVGPELLRLLG